MAALTEEVCCSWQDAVDYLKVAGKSIQSNLTEVALHWKQHIHWAKSKLSKMSAEHFASPATVALASQATIYDYAEHLSQACKKSSWNPIGAVSRYANSRTSRTTSGVIWEQIRELRQHVHRVTCPAVEVSACKAGCKYVTKHDKEKCKNSAPPVPLASFQNEEEYKVFHIKDAYVSSYCAQLENFSQKIKPLCQSADAPFASEKGTFGKVIDVVYDGLALWGIYSFAATTSSYLSILDPSYTDMQVSLGMNAEEGNWGTAQTSFHGAYFVLSICSSVAWSFKRSVMGLMDDSKACRKIAYSIQQLTS